MTRVAVLPRTGVGDPFHRGHTVGGLLARTAGAVELPGCPEPPRPDLAGHLGAFLAALTGFVGAPADVRREPVDAQPREARPGGGGDPGGGARPAS